MSRIALAVVAILLTDLEGGYVGVRQHLETIAAAAEHGFDEAFACQSFDLRREIQQLLA
jgi:hypothetical protein